MSSTKLIRSSTLGIANIMKSPRLLREFSQAASRADQAAQQTQEAIAQASVGPTKPVAQTETPNPTVTAG